MDSRRQKINKQAWDDVAPQVRDIFRQRQNELLAQAGLRPNRIEWGTRKKSGERNQRFLEFVQELLKDWEFEIVPEDTLDLIETFFNKPFGYNRKVLHYHLKVLAQEQPGLFDRRTDQLLSFG